MKSGEESYSERERGAAIVEFALVAPLLLLFIFGIVESGILLNQKQGLHAAAREGGRAASLPTATSDSIQTNVSQALQGVALDSPHTVTITPSNDNPCLGRAGQSVTVVVESTSSLEMPFFAGQQIDVSGSAVFRCEQ